jgi:hypothetical protein
MNRSGAAVAAILTVTGLISCSQPLTVEQRVIATIREMEAKIENGESRSFMEHIADDFSGQQEVMTRDQVRAMVIFQLHRHKRLQAQLLPIRVTDLGEGAATAHFRALVTGGAGWIPESGQVYDFETRWGLVGGDWLLQSAAWSPVALEEALQ